MKSSDDPNHRYLSLTGVIMKLEQENGHLTNALNALKQGIFGTQEIVLHRREMLEAKPPFDALNDPATRKRCDETLLQLLSEAEYRVFTVVIDKREHRGRYVVWQFHPYHYCLTVLLERYVQWLERINHVGDVMAESRGKKENIQLEKAYRYIYNHGSDHVPVRIFQRQLTSCELKIKPKTADVTGLQMADLLANPSARGLICEKTNTPMTAEFGSRVLCVLRKSKYLRNPFDGEISGWGTKWLP